MYDEYKQNFCWKQDMQSIWEKNHISLCIYINEYDIFLSFIQRFKWTIYIRYLAIIIKIMLEYCIVKHVIIFIFY
jgi:hypothetical protein